MEKENIKVKGYRLLADRLLQDDKKVFIKDINEDYYFADILLVGDSVLTIQCFAPSEREGKKFSLYYDMITRMEEYRDMEMGVAA